MMKKKDKKIKKDKEIKKDTERKKENDLLYCLTKKSYVMVCQYAINLVELKLRMLQESMALEYNRNVISSITSRIKTKESIERKLIKKNKDLSFENAVNTLNDLVGVRATCFYEDDIYEIVERISKQQDVKIIKQKDYIKTPKSSGYKSYHLIIDVPVYDDHGCKQWRVEIQLRTVAMDFWAQLDYQLCYKQEKDTKKNQEITLELIKYAEIISKMDKNMLKIRKEIECL